MSTPNISEAVAALAANDDDEKAALRSVLEAVLLVGQGLELDQALQRIVDAAADAVSARYCALGVRGPELSLQAFVYTGLTPEQRAAMGRLPVGQGVLGELLRTPEILRIDRLADHPSSVGFPENHPPMDTFLGAPILVRGELFGSIYLTEKQGAPGFTELDEKVVGVLAVAAGIAVDNARSFESARTRLRWMHLVADRGSEPVRGIDVAETLDGICEDVAGLAGAQDVFIVTGDELTAYTGDPVDVRALADAVVSRDSGLAVVEVAGDYPWLRGAARWVTTQPIQGPPGQFHAIVITHAERRWWTVEEGVGLAGAARVASLATVYAQQQQTERDLQVLEDRHRIARDLHDLVIQRLFAIGMSMQTMKAKPAEIDVRMDQAVADLDATIAQIRTSIFDLQSDIEQSGPRTLRRRVLDVVTGLAAHAPITPAVAFSGPVDTLVPDVLAPHIEAVLREGVSNALRHSKAQWIGVRIVAADTLTVEVSDDGAGIPTDVRRSGLKNLARRAAECGGEFTEVTGDGEGTRLSWVVPLI